MLNVNANILHLGKKRDICVSVLFQYSSENIKVSSKMCVKVFQRSLIEILNHLDHESLLNCFLVCKTWNYEISRSLQLMKKIKITMDEKEAAFTEKVDWMFMAKRKIVNIKFKNFGGAMDDKFCQIMKVHYDSLRSVEFDTAAFFYCGIVNFCFEKLNLESMAFDNCEGFSMSMEMFPNKKPTLKSLKLRSTTMRMLKDFVGADTTSLDVKPTLEVPSIKNEIKILKEFVKTQKNLRTLKIYAHPMILRDLLEIKAEPNSPLRIEIKKF